MDIQMNRIFWNGGTIFVLFCHCCHHADWAAVRDSLPVGLRVVEPFPHPWRRCLSICHSSPLFAVAFNIGYAWVLVLQTLTLVTQLG